MQRWLILAMFLAGCAAPDIDPEPAPAVGPALQDYVDCSWQLNITPVCDLYDPERYLETRVWGAHELDGWKCIAPLDPRQDKTEAPTWWFLRGPPTVDGIPSPTTYRVGFLFDLADRAGPFSGVLWDVQDDDGMRYVFTAEESRFFVPIPQVMAYDDALVQAVVLGALNPGPFGAEDEAAMGSLAASPAPGIINATNVDIEWLDLTWDRAPLGDGWPQPYPTHRLFTSEGERYLPVVPIVDGGTSDPRDRPGSAHWGGMSDGVAYTSVTDGHATVVIQQPIVVRGYVHYTDIMDPTAGWVCGCSWIPDSIWRDACLLTGGLVQPPPKGGDQRPGQGLNHVIMPSASGLGRV